MTAQILDPVPLSSLEPLPVQHDGQTWNLYRLDASEPVIRDVEWAQKLGFVRPADIRPLIKRMAESGRLGVIRTVRKTSSASGGRPTSEFLLTKKQALQVAAKSETEFADAILDAVIAVFLKVTGNGGGNSGAAEHLVPAHIPHDLARPLDALELMLKGMRQIEADTAQVRTRVDAQDETLAKLGTDVAAVKEFIEHAPLKEPAPPKVIVRYPSGDVPVNQDRAKSVLEGLAKYGPSIGVQDLAAKLGIPNGSISCVFAGLIGQGLITRHGKRNSFRHHLTAEGLKAIGRDLIIVARGSAKPKQPGPPPAKKKEAKPAPQPQLKLVMPPAPPAPAPQPTIACGKGTLARVQFRNHMQIIGGCLRWTEQQYQDAYNAIYARMAALGHDPRGKTELDPTTKKVKKIAPIEYLDRMGWAPEACEISLTDYPMSMLAEVSVSRPSDNLAVN